MKLYQQLHATFSLENVQVGIRQETQSFEAILVSNHKGVKKRIAHVVNYGTGGACVIRALPPVTQSWVLDKLAPSVGKAMAEQHPRWADLYRKAPGEALSSFCYELLERWSIGAQVRRQAAAYEAGAHVQGDGPYRRRAPRRSRPDPDTSAFKVGQQVKFGRPNGEKTTGEIIKINKKSIKVRILEDRGSKSKVGQVYGVHPSLCEVIQ